MRIVKELVGKEVVDDTAHVIGKVIDLEFDETNVTIQSIIINKGSITDNLGLSKNEQIIPYDVIKTIGDKILLNKTITFTQ